MNQGCTSTRSAGNCISEMYLCLIPSSDVSDSHLSLDKQQRGMTFQRSQRETSGGKLLNGRVCFGLPEALTAWAIVQAFMNINIAIKAEVLVAFWTRNRRATLISCGETQTENGEQEDFRSIKKIEATATEEKVATNFSSMTYGH